MNCNAWYTLDEQIRSVLEQKYDNIVNGDRRHGAYSYY